MDNNKIDSFKKELSDLLGKYNVRIMFICNDNSDFSGLINDRIVVIDEKTGEIIIDTYDSWKLTSNNINE